MATELTADTSVVVAALSSWHPGHAAARATLPTLAFLPAHVVAEAVAVLSRLPGGRALTPAEAVGVVTVLATGRVRQLPAARYAGVLGRLAGAGLGGGAVYDALVGATAREHGAVLLTLDRRAQRAYSAVGVEYRVPA